MNPNWQTVRLGDVAEVVGGGTLSTTNNAYWDGEISWITPKDLTGYTNIYIGKGERSISQKGLENSSARLLPEGTVLLTTRAPIGYVAIASTNLCTNQGFKSFIVDEQKLHNLFLFYWLKGNTRYLQAIGTGTTFMEIPGKRAREIEIVLPPLPTQRAIATTLSCLDEKIELNNRINANLEAQAQAIFKSWFVDFDPFKGGKFVDSELGGIPKGWRVGTLGDVCDVKGGKRLPRGENLSTVPNKHPYIRVRDLNNTVFVQMTSSVEYIPDDIQVGISQYTVSSNDMVLSIVGTIGLVCIVHPSLDAANLTENCVKLTNYNGVISTWLFLFLSSDRGKEQIRNVTVGAVQSKLPIKNIQSITFILPPVEVMSEFDRIVSGIFKLIAENCTQSRTLAAIRDTLLPKLMSGEVEVEE
ncbi:restriction endonuclease subunit S [Treponema sp. TIM-1]|uniref:restriction endonuclease subunit S n=1 Tax=Treponema sp. TIM-1 TaxID=2898417 RepID=UPI00397F6B63